MAAAHAGRLPSRTAAGALQLSPEGRAQDRRSSRCATSTRACCATAPAATRPTTAALHEVRPDATRAYQLRRSAQPRPRRHAEESAGARAPASPLHARARRLRGLRHRLRAPRTSTVLLLDMSWSMSWEGRFAAAKKVALAMESLIRTRYPRDYFGIVGFFTRAVELKLRDLPEASWNMGDPFTNLQDGLRLASELLGRHPSTQPAHDRDHRRAADRLLLARPALLRMAAVVRRHQHARRAGDAEGGRARHAPRHHHQHLHARRQRRACAPSSSA